MSTLELQPLPPPAQHAAFARRGVLSDLLSSGGWIRGTVMIPKLHSFVEALCNSTAFLKLVNVALPGRKSRVAFLALRDDAFVMILPDPADVNLMSRSLGGIRSTQVSCLFREGFVNGTLDVPAGTRVSDFLATHTRVFALRLCSVYVGGRLVRTAPLAVMNARQLMGITEPALEADVDN